MYNFSIRSHLFSIGRFSSAILVLTLTSACSKAPTVARQTLPFSTPFTVAHALGAIEGNVRTNSKEAFLASYQRGLRVFETDIRKSSDGVLILFHDENTKSATGKPGSVETLPAKEILSRTIAKKYPVTSFHELLTLIQSHPDTWLITDIKSPDTASIDNDIAKELKEFPGLQDRILPYAYTQNDVHTLFSLGFARCIFTIYIENMLDDDLISLVRSEPSIVAVDMRYDRFTETLASSLAHLGVPVIVHTLNEATDRDAMLAKGAKGIISDSL